MYWKEQGRLKVFLLCHSHVVNKRIAKISHMCWSRQGDLTIAELEVFLRGVSYSQHYHCYITLVKSLDFGTHPWSMHNMGITTLQSLLKTPDFHEDKHNKHAGYYSAQFNVCLSRDAVWVKLLLASIPCCKRNVHNWHQGLASGIFLQRARVISVVTGFCCRGTGAFGDIYDKETSFSLLPADLPTMWV